MKQKNDCQRNIPGYCEVSGEMHSEGKRKGGKREIMEALRKESGEYLIPLQEGLIEPQHIRGTIGELLRGRISGRSSREQITLFDALGLAAEDIACDRFLLTK